MKRLAFNIVCLQSLCLGVLTSWFYLPADAAVASGKPHKSDTTTEQKSSIIREFTDNKAAKKASKLGSNVSATSSQVKGKNIPVPQRSKLSLDRLPPSQVWVIGGEKTVQKQPFMWAVKDINKTDRQPFLQVSSQSQETTPKTNKKSAATTKKTTKTALKPFHELTKNTEAIQGLFNLYKDKEKNKVYLEIHPSQLNKNFLATATLESGIGEAGIYSGMPLQDFLFYFKRVNKNLHFIVRNVNFRAQDDDPQTRSLARSFSDSVLYTVKIKSIHPQRKTLLIDLGDLLLSDLAGLSSSLGVSSSKDKSYFGNAKAFPKNVEIESVLNFSKTSKPSKKKLRKFGALPDSRGFTLRVHYSLSQLPENNYQPRLADERVGYFITAYQDLSDFDTGDPFVRYINRWNLEKQDPSAAISPPKKPIVFWIDNAVPFQYRDAIKEGVLMWNKAFENAGFKDAIQVRQMPDDAKWDPSDIRYNTIRWINTVDGYFAMGPSRVNPLTGEILDADILVDASFVRALQHQYRQIVKPTKVPPRTSLSAFMQNRMLCTGNSLLDSSESEQTEQVPQLEGLIGNLSQLAQRYDLCYGMEAANQYAFGSLALQLLYQKPPNSSELKQYVHQYLRLIIAHEVGHTLGLRHNFRGSTLLEPGDMNDKDITRSRGITTSVMDYLPPNIAPPGAKQGDYLPSEVGVYDEWAIKYGYMPIKAASPMGEKPFLEKIAQESEKPELSYATDEDLFNLDPTADAWDNSGDVLLYSQWQLENSRLMWDLLNNNSASDRKSFSEVKEDFGKVLNHYFQQVYYVSKYIGGQSFYRVSPNNSQGKLPFEPVPADKQRKALATLEKYVFADDALKFSPQLLNKLAPSRWRHWGSNPRTGRLDYPIHDLVLSMQTMLLQDLLSSDRISRLKDIELKTDPEKALTIPELFNTLQNGIWTEVLRPKDKDKDAETDIDTDEIKISSLRRGLQGQYVNLLSEMVLRKRHVPEDARKIAWYKLRQLRDELEKADAKDEYTKIHLLETSDRIKKVLDAPLEAK